MEKKNCWEFTNCGREEGGEKAEELGVCPAATFEEADGFCDGKNGGRGCVYITGTFCSGIIQGTYREKEKQCYMCDFYKHLREEHKDDSTVKTFSAYVKKNKVKK